jgi:hypothetical protein
MICERKKELHHKGSESEPKYPLSDCEPETKQEAWK